MTNFERWQYLMKDVTSPQLYIDFGFYYLIAASLQRRVWVGPSHDPLFPNLYVVLVGDPAIGKGRVIKPVTRLLKHHKFRPMENTTNEIEDRIATKDAIQYDPEIYEMLKTIAHDRGFFQRAPRKLEDSLLIPVAADATTYEALVRALSNCTRRINYKDGEGKSAIYTHCSICFSIEELGTLFRRKMEDLVNFLHHTYDCGDYDYDTKTQGKDSIRRCCVSLFGGTTPNFMQRCFSDALLNEGFASRTFFIFSHKNRFDTLHNPELNEKQIACQLHLLEHIKKLSNLYGGVKFTDEAFEWMENWWKGFRCGEIESVNRSIKLEPYYGRKNIHLQKIALILHTSEHTDLSIPIPLSTVKRAMEITNTAERTMHLALTFEGNNKLAGVSRKILRYIKKYGRQTFVELLTEFFDDVTGEELHVCLEYLMTTGSIRSHEESKNNNVILFYELAL